MLVPVRGFRVDLADGHIGLAMLPAMYQGYVLALCLISNFSPFANQTLSIAGNNPPNGEQIEYGFLTGNQDFIFLTSAPWRISPGV